MSFLTEAAIMKQASLSISGESQELFSKVASDNNFTVNDMNMAYNLTSDNVNLYTNEGVIGEDDQVETSRLSRAVDLIVKQASTDPFSEEDALAYIDEIGLTADDYNEIYDCVPEDLVQKVASEIEETENKAGDAEVELTADDEVWEKVAEAHTYLTEAGLDPVEALNFAADFNEAETDEARDKVASETEELEQEEVDKIAETVEYLSDIEGIHPADLMAEWDKVAGSKVDAAKKALKSAGKVFSGAEVRGAEAGKARSMKAGLKRLKKEYKRSRSMPGDNFGGKLKQRSILKAVEAEGNKNIKAKKMRRIKAVGGTGAAVGAAGYAGSQA